MSVFRPAQPPSFHTGCQSLILCSRAPLKPPLQRSNLANARLKGLQEDLNLNDTQYATSLSILFAGYIFVRLPCEPRLDHWR